ncbi:hypothetical protein JCM9279_005967 [Rhodotorula babjevae]
MSSSGPAKPPKVKRKKQPKSNRLVRLPPSILRRIFADIGEKCKLGFLTLCRGLYAYALVSLYGGVALKSRTQARAFVRALQLHPERAELVEVAIFASGKSGQHALEDAAIVDTALYTSLILQLRSLSGLIIRGGRLATALIAEDLVLDPSFPRLSYLRVELGKEANELDLFDLGRNLTRLADLTSLTLDGLNKHMPVEELNLGPGHLPPRSLRLGCVRICKGVSLRPALRYLFQALAAGTTDFVLNTVWAYPAILEDLYFLPATVERMSLSIGLDNCSTVEDFGSGRAHARMLDLIEHGRERAPSLCPRPLSGTLSLPSSLVELVLQGDIVVADTFNLLLDLPLLGTLRLGTHTRFSSTDLVTFVETSPALTYFQLDVCECVRPAAVLAEGSSASARRRSSAPAVPQPVWRDGLSLDDAHDIVQACWARSITVAGTVICATKSAAVGQAHDCSGWCLM